MSVEDVDFCRVCRCEGTPTKPLFFPCMCTGSIKHVHQECLVQWLQYSKRQTCELCTHKFKFKPVYAADTPAVVPLSVLFVGLFSTLERLMTRCIHFATVLLSWLFVVPLTVCRIYKCLFAGNIVGLLSLPLDVLSTEHIIQDCIQGFLIVIIALAAFLGYVWLREQLAMVGEPRWLAETAENAPTAEHETPNVATQEEVTTPEDAPAEVPSTSQMNTDNAELDKPKPVGAEVPSTSPSPPDEVVIVSAEHSDESPPTDSHNDAGGERVAEDMDQGNAGVGDDFEAAGPMNWERIFGLDGTMTFLEHALWLIALNIFFITMFAFFPFLAGRFAVSLLGFKTAFLTESIEGLFHSVVGYIVMAGTLMILHKWLRIIHMYRASYFAGLFYIYLKVSIIAFIELGLFTVFCGLWIDACSLSMFNSSISQRLRAFNYAPLVFTFIHWTMGLMYIFYVSSLFLLIRDVLRPGLLWFLQDFNDPDYKPIQEMISLPVPAYLQRLIVNVSLTGIAVILSLWLPSLMVQKLLPGFLPFQLSLAYDSPVDYSVEIILLQIVLPFVLDGQVKLALHAILRWWCIAVSQILDLRSYLLGDVAFQPGDEVVLPDGRCIHIGTQSSAESNPPQNREDKSTPRNESTGNADIFSGHPNEEPASHRHAPAEPIPMLEGPGVFFGEERNGGVNYMPYRRPKQFGLRIFCLLAFLVISVFLVSSIALILPVGLGRLVLSNLGFTQSPHHDALTLLLGLSNIVGIVKAALYLPNLYHSCRLSASSIVNKFSLMTAWNGWHWISEQSLALCHWILRGGSLHPVQNRHLQAIVPIQQPHAQVPVPKPMHILRSIVTSILEGIGEIVGSVAGPVRLASLCTILLVLLPASLGLLINLIVFIPFRVSPEKSLVLGFSEHWIFGVMHMKVWLLILLVGPRWHVRDRLEEMHDEIVHHWPLIRTLHLLRQSSPLLVSIGLAISIPFILAHHLAPLFDLPFELVFRYSYPILFGIVVLVCCIRLQIMQCISLYEKIKDENYLIGRRLVNYGDREIPTLNTVQFAISE